MVGQEMASNYAVYQGHMNDLRQVLIHEPSMSIYAEIVQAEEAIVK